MLHLELKVCPEIPSLTLLDTQPREQGMAMSPP